MQQPLFPCSPDTVASYGELPPTRNFFWAYNSGKYNLRLNTRLLFRPLCFVIGKVEECCSSFSLKQTSVLPFVLFSEQRSRNFVPFVTKPCCPAPATSQVERGRETLTRLQHCCQLAFFNARFHKTGIFQKRLALQNVNFI